MGTDSSKGYLGTAFGIPITRSSNIGTNKPLPFEDMYKQITDYKQSSINDYTNLFWSADYNLQTKPVEPPPMRGAASKLTIYYDEASQWDQWDLSTKTSITSLLNKAKKETKPMAFKTGDTVRIIGTDVDGDTEDSKGIGYVGNITNDFDGEYEVDGGYCYPTSSLELVMVSAVTEITNPESLSVGDRVRLIGDTGCSSAGKYGNITGVTSSLITYVDDDGREDNSHYLRQFVLIINQGDTTMSDVTSNPNKALKNLNVDPDTRLLRTLGFETETGEATDSARVEVLRRQWAEIRKDVATDLRTAMANEKTDTEVTADKA